MDNQVFTSEAGAGYKVEGYDGRTVFLSNDLSLGQVIEAAISGGVMVRRVYFIHSCDGRMIWTAFFDSVVSGAVLELKEPLSREINVLVA